MAPQIKVKNLTKTFKSRQKDDNFSSFVRSILYPKYIEKKAVTNVSFEIDEGELIGFIGANGAGKTTTLKMLSGLLYPTSGSVSVMGLNPFERKREFLKNISLLMGQRRQLWWDLPVIDSLQLNKEIYDISDKDFKKTMTDMSDLFQIGSLINSAPRNLSLGERMKCEFVASILYKPKILFLDEPTIGLDIVMQRQMREYVRAYNQKNNATVILTSHYMEDVKELCERVIIISGGRIVYDGKLRNLTKTYADYRLLTITFASRVLRDVIAKYGFVESYSEAQSRLRVPVESARSISAKVMEQLPVEDVTIGDPTIEDVIGGIFGTTHPISK